MCTHEPLHLLLVDVDRPQREVVEGALLGRLGLKCGLGKDKSIQSQSDTVTAYSLAGNVH